MISGCRICRPRWALICLTNSGISRIRITTTRPTIDSRPRPVRRTGQCPSWLEQGMKRHHDERDGVVQRLQELDTEDHCWAPWPRGSCGIGDPVTRRRSRRRRRRPGDVVALTCGRNGVETAGVPRVAAQQPPHRQPGPAQRPVGGQRLDGVRRAGGVEPAARAEQRREHQLVEPDRRHQQPGDQPAHAGTCGEHPVQRAVHGAAEGGRGGAGGGRQHPDTSRVPAGSRSSRSRSRCRSRRRTRLRATAGPTARGTTKPTRAAGLPARRTVGADRVSSADREVQDHQPVGRTARAARSVALKSAERRSRAAAGQHDSQAESLERPLWRRAARMARPARVRIRRRKPCVFARRRLFGWNVRLLTAGLPGW